MLYLDAPSAALQSAVDADIGHLRTSVIFHTCIFLKHRNVDSSYGLDQELSSGRAVIGDSSTLPFIERHVTQTHHSNVKECSPRSYPL